DDHGDGEETPGVDGVCAAQEVERADARHDKTAGNGCSGHIVEILDHCPAIGEKGPKTRELCCSVRLQRVTDRVLHPGVGADNEIAAEPASEKDQKSRNPMTLSAELLLTVEQEIKKCGFKKKSE